MTFDAALELLGIDATASRKDARRAYLKRIKLHKPDRDPEMFRRVREAFELVDEEIEWRQTMAEDDHADDDVLWADFDEASVDEAHAAGAPRSPTDLALAPQSPSPADLVDEALTCLDDDADPVRAAALGVQAFDLARAEPHREPPSGYAAIHLCLGLFARRHKVGARQATRGFLRWLDESGAERELMGGWAGGCLAVLHGLVALPANTHGVPLGIMAQGVLDDDLDVKPALYSFAKDKPLAAHTLADALERHAPMLDEIWGEALRRGADAKNLPDDSGELVVDADEMPFWMRWGLYFILWFVVRSVLRSCTG